MYTFKFGDEHFQRPAFSYTATILSKATAIRLQANSHEDIRFERNKLYKFVEVAHVYCNSSTNSASKLRLAKCEAMQFDAKLGNLETRLVS